MDKAWKILEIDLIIEKIKNSNNLSKENEIIKKIFILKAEKWIKNNKNT